jgi:ubiquitin C-terminal hydrolase
LGHNKKENRFRQFKETKKSDKDIRGTIALTNCFVEYAKKEELSGKNAVYCDQCESKQKVVKQSEI